MIIIDDSNIYTLDDEVINVVNGIGICFLKTSSAVNYKRLMHIGLKSMQMFYAKVPEDLYSEDGCIAHIVNTQKQGNVLGIEGTIFEADVFVAGKDRVNVEFFIHDANVKAFHDYLVKKIENRTPIQ